MAGAARYLVRYSANLEPLRDFEGLGDGQRIERHSGEDAGPLVWIAAERLGVEP
jgi:hypothetical protein